MTVTATSTSTVAAPTSVESSSDQPAGPAPVNRVLRASSLITPSGNIRCLVLDNGSELHCAIGQHDFPIKRCQGQPGVTVLLNSGGSPHLSECADESFIGALLQPVGYDTTVELGDFSCDVSRAGVRCTNPADHGFHLARAGYEPF